MHVVILGARGQLGQALNQFYRGQDKSGGRDKHGGQRKINEAYTVSLWSRPQYDIASPTIVQAITAAQPHLVINAAAWTNVDGAEQEPSKTFAVNALGPKYLAEACARCGATLVHVSTNEVFAGNHDTYYYEYDQPEPRSIYARSKLAGELAIQQRLNELYIVRTAWLFGAGGNNFPKKIIDAADRHGALRVVADEFGNPSYAPDIAAAIGQLVESGHYGTYHLVNEGYASRFDFAQAVLAHAGRGHIPLTPISHTEWSRSADSPLHAVLVNQAAAQLDIQLRPWQATLIDYLAEEGCQPDASAVRATSM